MHMADSSTNPIREGTASATTCPLCRGQLTESPYARHNIVLQDESDVARNRRIESGLCHSCWEALFSTLVAERR